MTPAKLSKPFRKETGPEAVPPPESFSLLARRDEKVGARARAELEEHALGLGEIKNGFHVVGNGVDEAGGTLGTGFDADVEPNGGVESHLLVHEKVQEFVMENLGVVVGGEVAHVLAPFGDGIGDAADELLDGAFTLFGAHDPVEIFGDHDVGGRLGPGFGNFDILLFKNHFPFFVGDGGGTQFPFHVVEGMYTLLGEVTLDL